LNVNTPRLYDPLRLVMIHEVVASRDAIV